MSLSERAIFINKDHLFYIRQNEPAIEAQLSNSIGGIMNYMFTVFLVIFTASYPCYADDLTLFGKWEGYSWSINHRGETEATFCQFEIIDNDTTIEFVSLNAAVCNPAEEDLPSTIIDKQGGVLLFEGEKVGIVVADSLLYNAHYFGHNKRAEFYAHFGLVLTAAGLQFDSAGTTILDGYIQFISSSRGLFTRIRP